MIYNVRNTNFYTNITSTDNESFFIIW